MKIIGYLGSPKANGLTGKLMKRMLEGAESKGAETKKVDIIKCNIEHCRGCVVCFTKDPELPIGKCCIKDDMAGILEEYSQADGYVFGTPVYDMGATSIMKKFVERKIALTYRPREDYAKLAGARRPVNFKKYASMIVSGNSPDEYIEEMGDPCFETMEAHLLIEQVMTLDKFYVGGVETLTEERFSQWMDEMYQAGERLVEAIEEAAASDD